ncbi:MAG: hypothetical protein ABEN55_00250 [Bradymonadaceae bacterium]
MRRWTVVWTLFLVLAAGCVSDGNVGPDTSSGADAGADCEITEEVVHEDECLPKCLSPSDCRGDKTCQSVDFSTYDVCMVGPDTGVEAETGLADADAGDATSDTGHRPVTEEGPYNVGFEEMTVTLQRKKDGKEETVDLRTVLWYPTNDETGPAARYTVVDREGVYDGAKPAPLEKMPVMIFSHGNGGIAEQNYFMSEFWASRRLAGTHRQHHQIGHRDQPRSRHLPAPGHHRRPRPARQSRRRPSPPGQTVG